MKHLGLDRHILKLTFPIFIELVLQLLVGNADQIMVGWVDPNGVGAIGNANQISSLLIIVFSVICTASMILISQYLGAQNPEKLSCIYSVSLLVNILFGLVISLVLLFGSDKIFTLMGVKPEFFDGACTYMRIVGGGMVLQAVFLTFTAFFRSNQMMLESMVVSVLMNLLNLVGNGILINGAFGLPVLGVAGAAISSVLSRLVGVVVIAALFFKKMGPVLSWKALRPFPFADLKRLLAIGIPSGGESLSYNLSQVVIQTICNSFAVYMVNTRVYANMFANISYMFGSALVQASSVLVANLMGAGNVEETNRRVLSTTKTACLVSGVLSLLLWLLAVPLYSLFTKDADILALAPWIMLAEIPLEIGRGVNMTMGRCLQSCGDIRFPVVICIVFSWVVATLGGWLLGHVAGLGLLGVWIAMALDEDVRAVLFLIRWKRGAWREKRLI